MSARGSSSSAWLTPDVPNGGRSLAQDISPTGMRPDGSKAQVGLQNQARLWPTPDAFVSNDGEEPETFLARQERQKAKGINGNGMGLPLAMAAKTWPTPSASETRQGFQPRPEGKASDQNQQSLTTIAMLWPTPIVNDHKGANGRRNPASERVGAEPRDWGHPGLRGRNTMGDAAIGNGARAGQSETHHTAPGRGQHRRPERSLFPPGPGDVAGWRDVLTGAPELEPAVRRMADGLASRVDRLRMLGNGVVPLEGAYALRTLCARLAGRGSAGAARLVRMMGDT
jgi:hypothetical protein